MTQSLPQASIAQLLFRAREHLRTFDQLPLLETLEKSCFDLSVQREALQAILQLNPSWIIKTKKSLSSCAADLKEHHAWKECSFMAKGPYTEWKRLIDQKRIGCIFLAAGEGSRLGWSGPKATFPLTSNQTLFHLFFEKIATLGQKLPLAVMCSTKNKEALEDFLKKFSLPNLTLFTQRDVPSFSLEGQLFWQSPGTIAHAPCGNGDFFYSFYEQVWEKWKQMGIELLQVIPIDNPLALPFDPPFLETHLREGYDFSLQVIERYHQNEPLGAIASIRGQLAVVEYMDWQQRALSPCNEYQANSGTFCCQIDTLQKIVQDSGGLLPFHLVQKSKGGRKFYKCEQFFFDALPYTQRAGAIVAPRKERFAPLKNASDPFGPESVKRALKEQLKLPYST